MALVLDKFYYRRGYKIIVGTDEAGRGCMLGPVVAGAVILPEDFSCDLINDSKQLNEKQREEAYKIIIDNAIAYGIGQCSPQEIDQMNILNASREAMMRAINQIEVKYDLILTDAMKLQINTPWEAIIHGDAKSQSIAAASILAKVTRDHICYELDKQYPGYGIAQHKGYLTSEHQQILEEKGIIKEIYRLTYKPIKKYLVEKVSLF